MAALRGSVWIFGISSYMVKDLVLQCMHSLTSMFRKNGDDSGKFIKDLTL